MKSLIRALMLGLVYLSLTVSVVRSAHFIYKQSSGELFYTGTPVTTPFSIGYAGSGAGKNNPDLQCTSKLGPIPRGWYTIGEPSTAHGWTVEQLYLPLTPDSNNNMCDPKRSGFLIHGDSVIDPGWASEGCIIINKVSRQKILDAARGGSNRVEVVK